MSPCVVCLPGAAVESLWLTTHFKHLHTVPVHEQTVIYGFCPLLSISSGCSQFFRIKNNAWVNIFKLTAIFIYLVFKFRLISLGGFPGSEGTRARMGTRAWLWERSATLLSKRFFRIKGGRG